MWRRVLFSAGGVVLLSILSIVAYADSFSGKEPETETGSGTEVVQTETDATEVTAITNEIYVDPMIPVILETEPTEEPVEQNTIMSLDLGAW